MKHTARLLVSSPIGIILPSSSLATSQSWWWRLRRRRLVLVSGGAPCWPALVLMPVAVLLISARAVADEGTRESIPGTSVIDGGGSLDSCERTYKRYWDRGYSAYSESVESRLSLFEKALGIAERHWEHVPAGSRWAVSFDIVQILINMRELRVEQGEMANASRLFDKLLETHRRALEEETLRRGQRDPRHHVFVLGTQRLWAVELRRRGEFDESLKVLLQSLREADALGLEHSTVMSKILGSLAYHYCNSEERDVGLRYSDRLMRVMSEQTARNVDYYLDTLWNAEYHFKRDGSIEKHMDTVDNCLSRLEQLGSGKWVLRARVSKARMLNSSGRRDEALRLVTEAVSAAKRQRQLCTAGIALETQSDILMKSGRFAESIEACKEALRLLRQCGQKEYEPNLYDNYATSLQQLGQYESSLAMRNATFDLCESLNLHFRSLHMLFGSLSLHIEAGSPEGVEMTWARIERFLAQHPDMPKPTMVRYWLARLDYLKFFGREELLAESYRRARAFVTTSGLTAHEVREFSEYDVDENLTAAKAPRRTASVVCEPLAMVTYVQKGELARGRFLMYNTLLHSVADNLVLDGVSTVTWSRIGLAWKAELSEHRASSGQSRQRIEIPPGEAVELFLEAAPDASDGPQKITLQYGEQAEALAEWEFGTDSNAHETAVVNMSYSAENPFYCTSFYHEIYYRGQEDAVKNLRVTASSPTRIEFIHVGTGRLLAIDANGDGDFGDRGDVMYRDFDSDSYPDLDLDANHDAEAIVLLVFPDKQSEASGGEICIELYVEEDGLWQSRATDILRVK